MSDDDSFVVLGSSPMSSLELDDHDEPKATHSSPDSSSADSNFNSLKTSQLHDLQSAQETFTKQTEHEVGKTATLVKSLEIGEEHSIKTREDCQIETQMLPGTSTGRCVEKAAADLVKDPKPPNVRATLINSINSTQTYANNADNKLWSRGPQINRNTDELSLTLEDCAIKSPLDGSTIQNGKVKSPLKNTLSHSSPTNLEETCIPNISQHSTPAVSANSSIASSFIMGEINADVLKASVYSQFPSISMHSSTAEVLKLQNVVTENLQLKAILEKTNNTMRAFHCSSLQWQEKMNNLDTKYKHKLNDLQNEIKMLRKENKTLQDSLNTQMEAVEVARQKDREEMVKEISEKNALVENMRAQIIKLEQQHFASIEFVAAQTRNVRTNDDFVKNYITRAEHKIKMIELEEQLSTLLASNLDLKDVEKQYIDELNCLKVNLTSAEEIIKANRATIAQMQAQNEDRLQRTKQLEMTVEELRLANAEKDERILALELQNELYRKDFQIEQEGRSTAIKERQEILQDLHNLQKENKELMEQHQKNVENYRKLLNSSRKPSLDNSRSFVSAVPAARTYFNNPQRPIRNLPSTSSNYEAVTTNDSRYSCPICSKVFRSLVNLQNHVIDCMDK